jgi:hypothetical protein
MGTFGERGMRRSFQAASLESQVRDDPGGGMRGRGRAAWPSSRWGVAFAWTGYVSQVRGLLLFPFPVSKRGIASSSSVRSAYYDDDLHFFPSDLYCSL